MFLWHLAYCSPLHISLSQSIMPQPLISIVIPTKNRGALLYESINSLCEQLDNINCEIVVSDNCSCDNTKVLIDELKDKWAQYDIHYLFNHEDIGMSYNIANAIDASSGKYVHVLTDHIFANTGIRQLYSALEFIDTDSIIVAINDTAIHKDRVNFNEYAFTSLSIDSILSVHGLCLTWLCTFIFPRKAANSFASHIRLDSFHSFLPQTHYFVESLNSSTINVWTANFLSVRPVPKKGGYNILEVFVFDYLSLMRRLVLQNFISYDSMYIQSRTVLVNFLPYFVSHSIYGSSYSYKYSVNSRLFLFSISNYPVLFFFFLIKTFLSLAVLLLKDIVTRLFSFLLLQESPRSK